MWVGRHVHLGSEAFRKLTFSFAHSTMPGDQILLHIFEPNFIFLNEGLNPQPLSLQLVFGPRLISFKMQKKKFI
jgi:hypothetical protein